ncbi:MAG: O-antigen ligase family protein [Planctomycetes bacterium]|nr:O-antigen ligase family protein [Planctomycetota bacterium]MCB9891577.1 O-antigen ligase family protein [Planctomycetota bacterium]
MRARILPFLLLTAFAVVTFAIHPALRDPDLAKRELALLLLPLVIACGLPELCAALARATPVLRFAWPTPAAAFLLSGLWNDSWSSGATAAAWYVCLVSIVLVVAGSSATQRNVLLLGSTLIAMVVAAYGLLETVHALPSISPAGSSLGGGAPFAFSGNVAKTAELLLPGGLLALALAFGTRRLAPRALLVLGHAACIIALALSHTLAALVAFAIGAGMLGALAWRDRDGLAHRDRAFLTTLLATGILVLATTWSGVLRIHANTQEPTGATVDVSDRVTGEVRWRIYGSIVRDVLPAHPLVGFGAGRFAESYPPYRDPREADLSRPAAIGPNTYPTTIVDTAHSDPLQVLAESGLLGWATTVWVLVLLFAAAWRNVRSGTLGARLVLVVPAVVLVNACVRSPLLDNGASAVLFALTLGACLGSGTSRTFPDAVPKPACPKASVASLGLFLAFGFVTGARGVGADVQALRFTAARRAGNAAPVSLLQDALAWKPDRHDLRSLLALILLRESGAPERALAETRRALEDAPDSIELIGREADALLELAKRNQDLEARTRLVHAYQERQRRILELDPGLDAVRANLQRAEDLIDSLPFVTVEQGLERGVPNEPESALDELYDTLPSHPDLAERRASWQGRLEAIAQDAASRGRYLAMRKAYEALIAIAEDPGERALQIGEALHRASLQATEGSEPERFSRSYASYFTILGHERHLVRALERGDASEAEARRERLRAYPEYEEKPWFQLDAAAVEHVAGRGNIANILLPAALLELETTPDFPGLPASRRVYLQVFRNSPHLARLERLFAHR